MTGDNTEQREVRGYCFFHDLNPYNRQLVTCSVKIYLHVLVCLFVFTKMYIFFSLICSHNSTVEVRAWSLLHRWRSHLHIFSSVQSLSRVQLFATPWIAAHQASLSITNSWSSPKTHVHRVSDAIQPSHPLSSPSSPVPNPSQHQGLFQWVNSSHEVAKVLEFQL